MPDDPTPPEFDTDQADAIDMVAALASELISEYVEVALRADLDAFGVDPEPARLITNAAVLHIEVAAHRVLLSVLANPDPLEGFGPLADDLDDDELGAEMPTGAAWLTELRAALFAEGEEVTPDPD